TLPGSGKIIDIRRNLSLFKRSVPYYYSCGGSPNMDAEIFFGVDQFRAYLPVFLQQDSGECDRRPALIVKQDLFYFFNFRLTEHANRSYISIAADTIVSIDMIFSQKRENSHRYQTHIDLIFQKHCCDPGRIINDQIYMLADPGPFDPIKEGLSIQVAYRAYSYFSVQFLYPNFGANLRNSWN